VPDLINEWHSSLKPGMPRHLWLHLADIPDP
jgi:hypothetical protein